MVRADLIEKVTIEQRLEADEEGSHKHIQKDIRQKEETMQRPGDTAHVWHVQVAAVGQCGEGWGTEEQSKIRWGRVASGSQTK